MSLKYFHKYNIYYGNQIARTSVWMTLWPKVGPKPGNSYNWNCGFIFLPRSLIFPLPHRAIYFSKLQQLTFVFLSLPGQKSQLFQFSTKKLWKAGRQGRSPRGDRRELKITLPRISGSLSNWYAYWQASDLSFFWLHRQFWFCTQPCVKTWGIEHGTQKNPASST